MTVQDPCALLDRLLKEQGEAAWLEFKASNTDPQEIGQCVSALANAAMLAGRDRAFLVFGVEDRTGRKLGTQVRLRTMRKGGENFPNWLTRMVEPRIMLDFLDFECDGSNFAIIVIEPSYDRPVRFSGTEYLRIGENKKKLVEFPEHERALWLATGRRKFEDAVALSNQSVGEVLAKLNTDTLFELTRIPRPGNDDEVIRMMIDRGLIADNLEGGFDISNLGAILLARDISEFPSIAGKSVRLSNIWAVTKRVRSLSRKAAKATPSVSPV